MSPPTLADSSILWIGRMRFFSDLRIRECELAQRVASKARVVALDRSDATSWDRPELSYKLKLRWDLARGGWSTIPNGSLSRFRMPIFVGTGPLLNRLTACLNERRIERALERFGCRTVFHSMPFLFLPPPCTRRSYRTHFDLVDNFVDEFPDSLVGRSRRRFLLDAIARADSLSTISHSLCDRLEELTGRRPAYVPNGAALKEIRGWPPERAEAVRQRFRLQGKVVLTYIGNHLASFDGIGMLLEAFVEARRQRPELELLIVGPESERGPRSRNLGERDGVHVVGPVPTEEVWDYFHVADLGLVPFSLSPGTHDALPLKVLEYGAAGRPVLATPMRELVRLALPHVRFAPQDAGMWRRALLAEGTYERPDPSRLDRAMKPFCWDSAAGALLSSMSLASA